MSSPFLVMLCPKHGEPLTFSAPKAVRLLDSLSSPTYLSGCLHFIVFFLRILIFSSNFQLSGEKFPHSHTAHGTMKDEAARAGVHLTKYRSMFCTQTRYFRLAGGTPSRNFA